MLFCADAANVGGVTPATRITAPTAIALTVDNTLLFTTTPSLCDTAPAVSDTRNHTYPADVKETLT
jgi:hypothetical protein